MVSLPKETLNKDPLLKEHFLSSDWLKMFFHKGSFIFPLLLYFLLSKFIIQYKISVMMCFLLLLNVMFYIVRNEYLTNLRFLYCIPHCGNTFSLGLMTY